MRRVPILLLTLILILTLTACSQISTGSNRQGSPNPATTDIKLPKTDAVLTGKITQLYEDSCLLAATGTFDLYLFSSRLDIYDADGKAVDTSALKAGQYVEVGYSGIVAESYPAQLSAPVYIRITGQGDDLVGFYQTILNDLWNVDQGLNSDINVLAFDLSPITNLTAAEKSALVYVVSREHGLEGITGTFHELSEQGYIDQESLYFKTGLLFQFELTDMTEKSFTFDVTKWRSGDGAYIFHNCKAVKTGDNWSYTVGSEMIS